MSRKSLNIHTWWIPSPKLSPSHNPHSWSVETAKSHKCLGSAVAPVHHFEVIFWSRHITKKVFNEPDRAVYFLHRYPHYRRFLLSIYKLWNFCLSPSNFYEHIPWPWRVRNRGSFYWFRFPVPDMIIIKFNSFILAKKVTFFS